MSFASDALRSAGVRDPDGLLARLAAAWPALAARLAPGRPKLAGLLRHGATLPGSYFLRRALLLSRGDPTVFATRPISAGLLAAAILLVLVIALPNIRRQREEAFQEA